MNEIQIFQNEQFGEVRVAELNGEPVFCLADVCGVIGLTNPSSVAKRLDDSDKAKFDLGRDNQVIGNSLATYITESGFYDVILFSDSPKVKPFRKWVTSEVLPAIRKHGAYMTGETLEKALASPDFLIQLATNLKTEQQKRIEAEQQIAKLKPKAELMDKVFDSDEKIDIGQAAKILRLPFGRNTLFKKLRDIGVFFKNRNEPKQEYIDRKYFELKEKWVDRNEHDGFMVVKVLVTQRGLAFIERMMNGNKGDGKIVAIK